MPTFDEFAPHSNYPVIHSQRNDGVKVIATRIPLNDIRLEQWGWLLTQSYKSGQTDQGDIEGLSDNTGRQYPKIYTQADMQNYVEKWGCKEWEAGYQTNGYIVNSRRITTQLDAKTVLEDKLQEVLRDIQSSQKEQATQVHEQINLALNGITMNYAEIHKLLQSQTTNTSDKLLKQMLEIHSENQKQFEELNDEIQNYTQEHLKELGEAKQQISQIANNESSLSTLVHEDVQTQLEFFITLVKSSSVDTQEKILEAIKAQPDLLHEDTKIQLETLKESIETVVVAHLSQIKDVQERVQKILDAVDPELDMDKIANDDVTSIVAAIAKKPSSRIERIAINQIRLGNSYYRNANDQSKRSFELARIISIMGGVIFLASISATFVMLILHFGGNALLLNGIGALIAAIVEGIAGLNLLYDKTTKQFTRLHLFLDRIMRSSIAHAMTNEIQDEPKRQAMVESIVQELLKNDDRIKE